MTTINEVKDLLCQVLQLDEHTNALSENSKLLGALPELDSMAVVNILTALEEHYDFTVQDDEISTDIFATVGTLSAFVEHKLAN